MKILFVAQNFQTGGIQKSLLNILKMLSNDDNYDIDVFVFGKGYLIDEVPNNINIIYGKRILQLISTPFSEVKKEGNILDIFLRVISIFIVRLVGSKKFYRYLFKKNYIEKEYDIAISYFNDVPNNYFNQGTNQMVSECINANKKIAWIHTDPIVSNFDKDICKETYKDFDKIVCVSDACSEKFKKFLPIYAKKVFTVYNVFPSDEIKKLSVKDSYIKDFDTIKLITVARMDNNTKRIDKILEVIKNITDEGIDNFHWYFVGDGPDLQYNKLYADKLGINKYIDFLGEKNNPYPFIKESDLFVLASAYEGYPMVVGESLILETPVLTTNYAAAREQIIDGINGIIVDNDLTALYENLKNILLNPNKINKMKDYCINQKHDFNELAYNQILSVLESKYE